MKTIIYMNDKIRMPKPDGPVIRVETLPRQKRRSMPTDTNEAKLYFMGLCIGRVVYDPANNPSETHQVKAWVEFESGIEVRT